MHITITHIGRLAKYLGTLPYNAQGRYFQVSWIPSSQSQSTIHSPLHTVIGAHSSLLSPSRPVSIWETRRVQIVSWRRCRLKVASAQGRLLDAEFSSRGKRRWNLTPHVKSPPRNKRPIIWSLLAKHANLALTLAFASYVPTSQSTVPLSWTQYAGVRCEGAFS